jgi:hypothetical protein
MGDDKRGPVTDDHELLAQASRDGLAVTLAFALRFDRRKRKHDAAEFMAQIVAKLLVDRLERSGFVVMKGAPIGGRRRARV